MNTVISSFKLSIITPWWIILYTNLTGLREAQRAGKIFLGVSGRVLLKEINVWLSRVSTEICPHQCGGGVSSNPLRTRIEQKDKEGWIPSLLVLGPTSFVALRYQISWFFGFQISWFTSPCPGLRTLLSYTIGSPGSQVFSLLTEGHHYLSFFFSLQMVDYGTSQSS